MYAVPFLGLDSLSPESGNRLHAGLEVTAFLSAHASKFDVGRLASKRQCNHILSIQQESLSSLSWVAGVCHGCAKSPAAEQAFNGIIPPLKSLDVVKQHQKVPKIQIFSGGSRLYSSPSTSRPKPPIRNFEEQLAVLERIHLQSQAPPINSPELSEEAQVSRRSENWASKRPDSSFQECLEKQFDGSIPLGSHVDHSRVGRGYKEHIADAKTADQEPVWNTPFPGVCRAHASKNNVLGPPLGGVSQQANFLRSNNSNHPEMINGTESKKEIEELQRNAPKIDVYQSESRQHGSVQFLGKQDMCARDKTLMNRCHVSSQRAYDVYPYKAAQLSGNMNDKNVNGFHFKQGYGGGCPNAGEEASMVEGVQGKDSADVASSTSCKVASVRMPVYRMATPLQRYLSDSIFYLESLGVDCSRLFRDDPTTMKCTVKQLRTLVCALERQGLKSNDFGRIFNLCPKVLHLKPDGDLKAVTGFLFDEVGLLRKDFGKVIRRCPRLLVADVPTQLRPTLSFLRNLGYLKMGQVVSNNPTLLSFSVERKLKPKLRFLESLGFTYREAASMVVRFPAIFNYSISDNLQPKYDYLVQEMGGRNKDLLAFPQYFGYSLETRIRPRHECVAKVGMSLSIQAILKLSDAEFEARFLSGAGQECCLFASPETGNTTLQECSLDSAQFASFEHTESRVLVSV